MISVKEARQIDAAAKAKGIPMSEIKRRWNLHGLTIADLPAHLLPKVMEWIERKQ